MVSSLVQWRKVIGRVFSLSLLCVSVTSLGCGTDTGESFDASHDVDVGDSSSPGDLVSESDLRSLDDVAPSVSEHADWMSELLIEHAGDEIALVDIAIPRSHDTGTYLLTTCTVGAVACNTQTQHLSMSRQLEAGVRAFDIRPMLAGGEYFSHHTTNCDGLGCQGDSIANILAQTRDFLDSHSELVILEISHYCDTSADDEGLVALVVEQLGGLLFVETEAEAVDFIQRPLIDIIPPEEGVGQVVVLWDGVANTPEQRSIGRFSRSYIPNEGGWSNKQDLDELIEDQLERYAAFDNDGSRLFELSWTMTMDTELAVDCFIGGPRTIETMAIEANDALPSVLDQLIEDGDVRPGRIPNILSVDFADEFVTEQCSRLNELNLQ